MGTCTTLLAAANCSALAMLRIVFLITDQKFATGQCVRWVFLLLAAAALLVDGVEVQAGRAVAEEGFAKARDHGKAEIGILKMV